MPLLHEARHSASPMSSAPASRLAPHDRRPRDALVASRHATSVSPSSTSTSTRPPATPPQDGSRAHSLYSCGSLSYEGVHFSTPVRSRTISSSTPSSGASPSRLPIGSPARATERRSSRRARPSVPTGLGLVDLEKLALAPSPQADASREERAQRRRAVHFNSHAQFSDALRRTLAQPDDTPPKGKGTGMSPEQQTLEPGEVSREMHGTDMESDDDENFLDDEDFSWEAVSSSPGNTPGLRSSSMHELAAAFPSPPKSAPEFPLSLFSLERDTPPSLPLPPTPPLFQGTHSPHVYANPGFTESRIGAFDPDESMARLEMSMAKLEGFGPMPDAPEPACFFDDDEDEEEEFEEVQLDSNSERDTRQPTFSQQGHKPAHLPDDVSPPLTSSDSTDASSPLSDAPSSFVQVADVGSPEVDSDAEARMERLLRCLSPTNMGRPGFEGSSPSTASFATSSTPRTPSVSPPLAPPSIELLPEFDFEKTRRVRNSRARGHKRRSSSLSNPLTSGWQSFASPGMDIEAKPQPVMHYNIRTSSSTGTSSASAYSSLPHTASSTSSSVPGHARTPSAEYRSRGIQTHVPPEPARPESPLRKARSTPFIRRPVRYEPAQPILQQKRAIAPPLPPLPSLPPLPPIPPSNGLGQLPGSLALARSATHSPNTSRESERARVSSMRASPSAPFADGHTPPSVSWRRAHQPIGSSPTEIAAVSSARSRMSGTQSPHTPPNGGGQSSFMHITPEQPNSRMSRLWNRARAGLSRTPESEGRQVEGRGVDSRKGLKAQKSTRWLRGSMLQSQGE